MDAFDPKIPDEDETYSIDFSDRLWAGETLARATVTITLLDSSAVKGDGAAPLVSGDPICNSEDMQVRNREGHLVTLPAGAGVLQKTTSGLNGANAKMRFKATTTLPRVLIQDMELPVRETD